MKTKTPKKKKPLVFFPPSRPPSPPGLPTIFRTVHTASSATPQFCLSNFPKGKVERLRIGGRGENQKTSPRRLCYLDFLKLGRQNRPPLVFVCWGVCACVCVPSLSSLFEGFLSHIVFTATHGGRGGSAYELSFNLIIRSAGGKVSESGLWNLKTKERRIRNVSLHLWLCRVGGAESPPRLQRRQRRCDIDTTPFPGRAVLSHNSTRNGGVWLLK